MRSHGALEKKNAVQLQWQAARCDMGVYIENSIDIPYVLSLWLRICKQVLYNILLWPFIEFVFNFMLSIF